MLNNLEQFYLAQAEPVKSCFFALRELILNLDEHLEDAWKYRMPFFYYQQKMFCYLWTDKKTNEPYIGIAKGNKIDHPLLEQGNRTRIKILRIDPNKDLPVEEIKAILHEALDLYK